ncbi:MAG: hypothetical protein AAF378_13025 [Cyanobacteria bacterium P01_A01_bin.84]
MTVSSLWFCLGLKISFLFFTVPTWGNTVNNKAKNQLKTQNTQLSQTTKITSSEAQNLENNLEHQLKDKSQIISPINNIQENQSIAKELDLDPKIIEESPVLQRWQRRIPNVLLDIRNDPSFRTRFRIGYHLYPSRSVGGIYLGFEDVFTDVSRLTIRGDYQVTFDSKYRSYGTDAQYYLRPMGGYLNFATIAGYRYLKTESESISGINLGVKVLLVLSRGGGADISLTQSWVAPTSIEEAGFTTLSFSYAIAPELRLSTDIQQQNTKQRKDRRLSIIMEWMP